MTFAISEMQSTFPRRIVCLSDEVAELIYLLGRTGSDRWSIWLFYSPPKVRLKPRVSTFRDANFDAIARLDPDLIITYSDVQADITREASLRGLPVLNCNQRSIAEDLRHHRNALPGFWEGRLKATT